MTQQSLHLLAARFLGQHVGSTAPLFLAVLAVHVVAGTTAVITGATAALAHKPGLRHLRAGRRYYRAIIVLSGTGAVLAVMRWREDAYLLVIAAVMVTAATIGVRARRRRGRAGRHHPHPGPEPVVRGHDDRLLRGQWPAPAAARPPAGDRVLGSPFGRRVRARCLVGPPRGPRSLRSRRPRLAIVPA